MIDRKKAIEIIQNIISKSRKTHKEWTGPYDIEQTLYTYTSKKIIIESLKDLGFGDCSEFIERC